MHWWNRSLALAAAFVAMGVPAHAQQEILISVDVITKLNDQTLVVARTPTLEAAVLSDFAFDAVKQTDRKTIEFAGTKALATHSGICDERDANSDGLTDLVCAFETKRMQLTPDSEIVQVTGKLLDGTPFTGEVTLYVVKD